MKIQKQLGLSGLGLGFAAPDFTVRREDYKEKKSFLL